MKKQTGFTLIEIMISLVLGLIILGATISIYIASIRGSSDVIRSARLNYDLDSALSMMANDIRRSGYWGGAIAGSDPSANPFMQGNANLRILDSGTCIVYSYDADGNESVDTNEYYGFKLNGAGIQMRLSGTADKTDCSSDANNSWESITITAGNQQIEITSLQFSLDAPVTSKCLNVTTGLPISPDSTCAAATSGISTNDWLVESRQINIVLRGRVAADTAVTKSLSQSVKLRNDRIFQWP